MFVHALAIAASLFCLGLYGLLTSTNMIRALMCLELLLNGVNLNFVTFATYLDPEQIQGELFAIFLFAIAAAEAAIGLAIVFNIYKNRLSIRLDHLTLLRW